METLRQYIISVTAAAIVCGVLSGLVGGKQIKFTWKLIVGVFLSLTAIRPLSDIDINALPVVAEEFSIQAEDAVQTGQEIAATNTRMVIKSRLETYILDKATAMGVKLKAEVSLDGGNLPISVRLTGAVSPGAKSRLQTIIANDLGIPKEAQIWNG